MSLLAPQALERCWLPTSQVSRQLGLSGESLRRYARSGVLQLGHHYRPGLTTNSPWLWDLTACEQLLVQLGAERFR